MDVIIASKIHFHKTLKISILKYKNTLYLKFNKKICKNFYKL